MSEREIYAAASERSDPAARAAFLDEACGGDTALRSRVEQLLSDAPASTPAVAEGYTRTLPPGAGHPDFAVPGRPYVAVRGLHGRRAEL